jgi:hypothetical protein
LYGREIVRKQGIARAELLRRAVSEYVEENRPERKAVAGVRFRRTDEWLECGFRPWVRALKVPEARALRPLVPDLMLRLQP